VNHRQTCLCLPAAWAAARVRRKRPVSSKGADRPGAPRAAGRRLRAAEYVRRCRLDDRGDVPGWVLVTLMTAGLVLSLWAVAGPALQNVFDTAISRVLTGI
jgi:hypothetical protein